MNLQGCNKNHNHPMFHWLAISVDAKLWLFLGTYPKVMSHINRLCFTLKRFFIFLGKFLNHRKHDNDPQDKYT